MLIHIFRAMPSYKTMPMLLNNTVFYILTGVTFLFIRSVYQVSARWWMNMMYRFWAHGHQLVWILLTKWITEDFLLKVALPFVCPAALGFWRLCGNQHAAPLWHWIFRILHQCDYVLWSVRSDLTCESLSVRAIAIDDLSYRAFGTSVMIYIDLSGI